MYVISGIWTERNEEYLVDNYARPNRSQMRWIKDIDSSIERMVNKLPGVNQYAIKQLIFSKEQ